MLFSLNPIIQLDPLVLGHLSFAVLEKQSGYIQFQKNQLILIINQQILLARTASRVLMYEIYK